MLYDVDRPELISVAETGFFAPPVAAPFDRMGWRYLRLHVARTVPGGRRPRCGRGPGSVLLHEDTPLQMPFHDPVGDGSRQGWGNGSRDQA